MLQINAILVPNTKPNLRALKLPSIPKITYCAAPGQTFEVKMFYVVLNIFKSLLKLLIL